MEVIFFSFLFIIIFFIIHYYFFSIIVPKDLSSLTSVLAKKVHSSDQVAVNIFPSTFDSLKLGLFSALQL